MFNRILHFLLPAVAACSAPAIARQTVEISLRPAVVIHRAQVRLGDVADLAGGDQRLLSQLRAMRLGAAPRTGSINLGRAEIERWVRRHAAGRQPQWRWSGAAEVEISAARQRVAGSEIGAVARAALQHWLAARSERSEIEQSGSLNDIMAPGGQLSMAARALPEGEPRSRMQLWVEVRVDEHLMLAVPVSFQVRAYRSAYVARRDMASGSSADASQFERRQVDVAPLAGAALPVSPQGQDWRTRRPVRRGDVLLARQVEAAPVVQRGQSATLRAQAGILTIESVVEVLQDGYAGQLVKVKGAGATGAVMARVAAPGLLEMTER